MEEGLGQQVVAREALAGPAGWLGVGVWRGVPHGRESGDCLEGLAGLAGHRLERATDDPGEGEV
jgi:hypothetical protein